MPTTHPACAALTLQACPRCGLIRGALYPCLCRSLAVNKAECARTLMLAKLAEVLLLALCVVLGGLLVWLVAR